VRGEGAINNGFSISQQATEESVDIAGYQVDNNLNVAAAARGWCGCTNDMAGTLALRWGADDVR